jgi:TPR repeat protein
MNKFAACVLLALLLAPVMSSAAGIRYYEDPVYSKLNAEDEHPMSDLVLLAERGDARAQYILADLYGKGKGGLAKNLVKSRFWFESAARHGLSAAFIRLAALARNSGDGVSAYKWYTLSAELAGGKEAKWSRGARTQLIKNAKLSPKDVRLAEDAAAKWRRQQGEAMRTLEKQEQHARETGPAPDLGEKSADQQAKEKTAAQDKPKRQKEYRFND